MAPTIQTTRCNHVEVQNKASVSVLVFNGAESGRRFTMVMLNKSSEDER
jgi:hypothetical protein